MPGNFTSNLLALSTSPAPIPSCRSPVVLLASFPGETFGC